MNMSSESEYENISFCRSNTPKSEDSSASQDIENELEEAEGNKSQVRYQN